MFDTSFLEPAALTFTLVADTHAMLAPENGRAEFASRLRQSRRAETAMAMAAALRADLDFHLGDLVQAFPESPGFSDAVTDACRAVERAGFSPWVVPGNHDVGDKPDPTMPTEPVTPASLAHFHARFGPSWRCMESGAWRFVLLNSQILNTGLPEEAEQWDWLETALGSDRGRRLVVLLHLPPFLDSPAEAGLGHYDNIGEPARTRLLTLLQRSRPELVCAAHVHWRFFDRLGDGTGGPQYHTVPSTSFTRPGFSHAFCAGPPPEQGRDDAPKLGFLLGRAVGERLDVHLVRTAGTERLPAEVAAGRRQWLVTRTSAGLPASPLGVTLRHALCTRAEVPLAWPSVVRQPVRNDYPFLALLELGVRYVRTPASDLASPLQTRRLALLREEGVSVRAMSLLVATTPAFPTPGAPVDEWEFQIPGGSPTPANLAGIQAFRRATGLPIALSPIEPNDRVPGKQHHRTRLAYRPEELDALNELLAAAGVHVDRVVVGLPGPEELGATRATITALTAFSHIGALDLRTELAGCADPVNTDQAVLALFGSATPRGNRVYVEPLVDLDRTMDVSHGLLDPHCNPRPAFHALRCLNTLLFSRQEEYSPIFATSPGRPPGLRGTARTLELQFGRAEGPILREVPHSQAGAATEYLLCEGLRSAPETR